MQMTALFTKKRPQVLASCTCRGVERLPTLLSILLLAVIPLSSIAIEISGRVVGVTDGDTLTLLDAAKQQHKIRLAGIDAPEKSQPHFDRSKEHLSGLIFNRQVTAQCGKKDKYRRRICKIFVNGSDVNREQIAAGMAWWYRKFAKEQQVSDRTAYERAERDAQQARRGLWRESLPVPPWEWRLRQNSAR